MAPRVFRQTRSGDEIIQLAVRLGLLAFLLYWSFVLVRPFIPILVWSMVLTVALYPPYHWLSVHLGDRPKLAAVIITAINLAIIIGPVTWLGLRSGRWLARFCGPARRGHPGHSVPSEGVKDWPIVGAQIYELWDYASTNLRAALRELAPHLKPLAGPVLAFAGSAGVGTLKFVAVCRAVRFPVPLRPRPRRGNKEDSGASRDAAKRRFCCAGRADDTHGVSRSHRRCRSFNRCWPESD